MTKTHNARSPILVTGVPRSGTTWLARLLAEAPGMALTGREPMNPRGRQYALAGTLTGWAMLTDPNRRQARALRMSYKGRTPLVFSRYGHRQWAALLPRTRLVVKDPFAMLSMPLVHEITGASPVLLFRHPGAVLTSYRRMGWTPDVEELDPIVTQFTALYGHQPGIMPAPEGANDVSLMAWFWNILNGIALFDADRLGTNVTVLSHEDVAVRGQSFVSELFHHLGIAWQERVTEELEWSGTSAPVDDSALHNFDRNPAKVAHEWKTKVTANERDQLEKQTQEVLQMLRERTFCSQVDSDLDLTDDESYPNRRR